MWKPGAVPDGGKLVNLNVNVAPEAIYVDAQYEWTATDVGGLETTNRSSSRWTLKPDTDIAPVLEVLKPASA